VSVAREAVRFLYRVASPERTWNDRDSLWPVSHGSRSAPGASSMTANCRSRGWGKSSPRSRSANTEAERAADLIPNKTIGWACDELPALHHLIRLDAGPPGRQARAQN